MEKGRLENNSIYRLGESSTYYRVLPGKISPLCVEKIIDRIILRRVSILPKVLVLVRQGYWEHY